MRTLLVQYDLLKPTQNYTDLIDAIKLYPWAKPLYSAFFIRTEKTPKEIVRELLPHIDADDKLLVVECAGSWWSENLPEDVLEWLHRELA